MFTYQTNAASSESVALSFIDVFSSASTTATIGKHRPKRGGVKLQAQRLRVEKMANIRHGIAIFLSNYAAVGIYIYTHLHMSVLNTMHVQVAAVIGERTFENTIAPFARLDRELRYIHSVLSSLCGIMFACVCHGNAERNCVEKDETGCMHECSIHVQSNTYMTQIFITYVIIVLHIHIENMQSGARPAEGLWNRRAPLAVSQSPGARGDGAL